MIVKKLNDVSGGGFPGARYNEKKIADGVATLMAMENVSEALRHNVETLHRFGLDASAAVSYTHLDCEFRAGLTLTSGRRDSRCGHKRHILQSKVYTPNQA